MTRFSAAVIDSPYPVPLFIKSGAVNNSPIIIVNLDDIGCIGHAFKSFLQNGVSFSSIIDDTKSATLNLVKFHNGHIIDDRRFILSNTDAGEE